MYLFLQPEAGVNLPTRMDMVYDSTNHYYTVSNFLTDNRWYCMEARFKTSSPYNFTTWVDGVQLASVTPSSPNQPTLLMFNIINANEFTNLDLTNWTDGLTVSTSRIYCSSVIEIGNNSDYATATKKYQEPIYLSDGSIQIKADLAGLGSGPYYLWVTNNKQERSVAYNLSAGGDITPPATPQGLSVQ